MSCSQCIGIENTFDEKLSAAELRRYRRRGPRATTRALVQQIVALGVEGRTVLDVGGGVGAVHFALLSAGARSAVDVDASAAYLRTAGEEAGRRGLADRVTHRHGNFVDLAPGIPPADIVTLDRVICCYDDVRALLAASAERTKSVLGLVHPVDTWLSRLYVRLVNLAGAARGSAFRSFIHPQGEIDSVVRSAGLENRCRLTRGAWQVSIYVRGAAA